ncbi:uncharacterized protein EV422DRAFT_490892 [Fimicolochytrium jonesii]|uniref:uncharacterized protein n=1 Tax=Fimicolochytrium jonesii TaxID=1396493 RepID=UPI0022FEEBA5|nr:uncharacterized protein EV422DRAFT_490892 [Fimicolochytrium jonesii]KAI8826647.1 hypothetical protein EV422DRAFT_490892 [Fimicolochytrium jonesii]
MGAKVKLLVEHSRSLLALHHAFARGAFPSSSSSSKSTTTLNDGVNLDVSRPVVRPEEEILEEYWEREGIVDEADRIFMKEVLNGCVRHRKVLEVALKMFYAAMEERLLRNEYNLYAVLFYLTLFRLSDLSFPKLRSILLSYPPTQSAPFVRFVFDAQRLTGDLQKRWNAILDAEWVKENIINPVLSCVDLGHALITELEERGAKGMVLKKTSKAPTESHPFLLTKPKPRRIPSPTDITTNVPKARAVPKSVYDGTGDFEALERTKAENRERALQAYAKAETQQFAVVTRTPPVPTRAQTPPSPPRPRLHKPVPANLRDAVPIKLTTAAILREDALVRRHRREEEVWLSEVEMGLRDGGEFREWENEAKMREEEDRKLEQEKRKLEIQLMREEAYIAKQDLLKENRERAQDLMAERETLRATAQASRKELEEENRKKVEEIQGMQEDIQKAKKKVMDDNLRKAADITHQTAHLRTLALKAQEEELARKSLLIAQIRQLERSIPSVGSIVKFVDPTETSHVGLLSEMSVTELQERLLVTKQAKEEEEERRREEIGEERRVRVALIRGKLEDIERERGERRRRRREAGRRGEGGEESALVTSTSAAESVYSYKATTTTATSSATTTHKQTSETRELKHLRDKLHQKRAARLAQPPPLPAGRSLSAKGTGHAVPDVAASSEWIELDIAEREYRAQRGFRKGTSGSSGTVGWEAGEVGA